MIESQHMTSVRFGEGKAAATRLLDLLAGWSSYVAADEENALIGKLKEAGVTITTPDPTKFRAAVEPANAELRKVVGEADWKLWQGFVEEGRKRKK